MSGLPSLESLLLSSALAALIAGAGTGWVVHKVDAANYERLQLKVAQANINAITAAVKVQAAADAITQALETKSLLAQQKIETKIVTLTEKVPYYVTPETDKRYPLPLGFCELHDAAAGGTDPSSDSLTTALAHDTPCTVTASEAISVIIQNYGQYNKVAEQLADLQGWALEEQKAIGK